jgi:hypothetical protein
MQSSVGCRNVRSGRVESCILRMLLSCSSMSLHIGRAVEYFAGQPSALTHWITPHFAVIAKISKLLVATVVVHKVVLCG